MEIIMGLALILALIEWRDYKLNRKHKQILLELKRVSHKLHYVGNMAEKIEANNKEISALKAELEPAREFINKAHTDLETIVQEYKVNGVPLGWDRNTQKFDVVEGL